jgi:transcriptional regulator
MASAATSAAVTTRRIGSVARSSLRRFANSSPSSAADNGVSTNPAAMRLKVDFGVRRRYIDTPYMEERSMSPEVEWKKVSAELLILSLVEARPRHGYEISKLIEQRSGGTVRFYVASLYPLLYRLEKRGWIQGRWVEKSGQRRRRYYRLTSEGQKVLASQRRSWQAFVEAVNRITEAEHA